MYTMLAFLVKKQGLTLEEFISYYEEKHVPLIDRVIGHENRPLSYTRRYINREDPAHALIKATVDASGRPLESIGSSSQEVSSSNPSVVDFDAVTETVFSDQAAAQRWLDLLARNSDIILADEDRFLWKERRRVVVLDEVRTSMQ